MAGQPNPVIGKLLLRIFSPSSFTHDTQCPSQVTEHNATPVSHPLTISAEVVSMEILFLAFHPAAELGGRISMLWKLIRSFLQSLTKIGQLVIELQVRRHHSDLDLLFE